METGHLGQVHDNLGTLTREKKLWCGKNIPGICFVGLCTHFVLIFFVFSSLYYNHLYIRIGSSFFTVINSMSKFQAFLYNQRIASAQCMWHVKSNYLYWRLWEYMFSPALATKIWHKSKKCWNDRKAKSTVHKTQPTLHR